MRTWEALIALEAARQHLSARYLTRNRARMEANARSVLRMIGLTNQEVESEYPNARVAEGIKLIEANPEEFIRQCQEAARHISSRN